MRRPTNIGVLAPVCSSLSHAQYPIAGSSFIVGKSSQMHCSRVSDFTGILRIASAPTSVASMTAASLPHIAMILVLQFSFRRVTPLQPEPSAHAPWDEPSFYRLYILKKGGGKDSACFGAF